MIATAPLGVVEPVGVLAALAGVRLAADRFIAMASVSCASCEMEPYDMAPVENRLTIVATGSTSSIGTGCALAVLEARTGRAASSAARPARRPGGVLLEDVVAARAGGVLQPEDGLRVEQVRLALAAPLVLPADLERAVRGRGCRRAG